MPFFMERKNEGKIKLTIFSHGVVAYRFGPHKQKCGMSASGTEQPKQHQGTAMSEERT